MEDDNSTDDFLDEFFDGMWASCPPPSEILDYVEEEKYLGDYISEDYNDVCFVDEVGYIPYIESSMKNVIHLMEIEKIKHDLNIDIDSSRITQEITEEKKKKCSSNRLKTIRSMYDYQGKVAKIGVVQNTGEKILSWYVHGFDTVEKVENIFALEDIYEMDIDLKVYVEDQCKDQYMDGRKHLKFLQYFKAFIDQNGEQYLKEEVYCIGVIISALIDLDLAQSRELNSDYIVYKVKESIYSTIAIDFYKKHYEDMIPFLVQRYKKSKTDIELNLSRSERKSALLETGKIVQSLLQIDVEDYESLEIFFRRINGSHQGLTSMLGVIEKAEVNYIMSTDNKTLFYPYIVDILLDIYRYCYMVNSDKENIDKLKPALVACKDIAYKEQIFADKHLYHKVLVLDSVKRNQVNRYLLNQYHKIIQSDFVDLSRFYSQLIFRPNQEVPDYYKVQMNIDKIPLSTSFRFYSIFIK
jgi:hypothetical protein